MNLKRIATIALSSFLTIGSIAPTAFAWDNDADYVPYRREYYGRDDPWQHHRHAYREGYEDGYRAARYRNHHDRYYRPSYYHHPSYYYPSYYHRRYYHPSHYYRRTYYNPAPAPYWVRGQRYDGPIYTVDDYDDYRVHRPPPGYQWIRDDRGNLLLVAIATGIIADLVLNHH